MRRGFTLVECLLAGALLSLLALALLEGVGVSNRVARENAQVLAADGVVWDAIWKKFNEDFDRLQSQQETLDEAAAPDLYLAGSEAELRVSVAPVPGFPDLKSIVAEVEWGPAARRMVQTGFVYRSSLRRVPWQ